MPSSFTSSGLMLCRTPPWNTPTVTTEGSRVTFMRRETMVCRPSTIWELTTIGSTPRQGIAAWVCVPRTKMRKSSAEAMRGPER